MRLLIMLVLLCLLLHPAAAQGLLPPMLVAYQDASGAVMLYAEQTDERIVLLPAQDVPAGAELRAYFSPNAMLVAVIVAQVSNHLPYPGDQDGMTIGELGYQNQLYVMSTGMGELLFSRPLLPQDFVIEFFMPGMAEGYQYDTLLEAGFGVQWSPDRRYVLWVEGTAGPVDDFTPNGTGRLMAYDLVTEELHALTETPGTPFGLMWSPDGRYAVYRGISSFGTGAGYASTGSFLISFRDLSTRQLVPCCRDIEAYGWLNSDQFVYSYFSPMAGAAGLFVYRPADDSTLTLLPAEQDNINSLGTGIHGPGGRMLLTVSDIPIFPEENARLDPGTYLYRSPESEPELIYNLATGQPADRAALISADTVFVAGVNPPYAGAYSISSGELLPDEMARGYVYTSSHGVLFTQADGGILMYRPALEGGGSYLLPGLFPDRIEWLDSEYLVSYWPHQYSGQPGSDYVLVASALTGAFKTVSAAPGSFVLAAGMDFRMR